MVAARSWPCASAATRPSPGAIHDLVDEAKQHDLPESALLALISEAYRWAPSSPRVLRTPTTR